MGRSVFSVCYTRANEWVIVSLFDDLSHTHPEWDAGLPQITGLEWYTLGWVAGGGGGSSIVDCLAQTLG
jgi:hypothetical protein